MLKILENNKYCLDIGKQSIKIYLKNKHCGNIKGTSERALGHTWTISTITIGFFLIMFNYFNGQRNFSTERCCLGKFLCSMTAIKHGEEVHGWSLLSCMGIAKQ